MKHLTIYFFFFVQFFYTQNPESYIKDLNGELEKVQTDNINIKSIIKRESAKYAATNNRLFYLSSKYADLYLKSTQADDIKNISKNYELIKINNGNIKFIDIYCYFILSQNFGSFSPQLSMEYIDNAISASNNTPQKELIEQLYNYKARLYYNSKNYSEALVYYQKALEYFEKNKNALYVSSMHNNIGLVYKKKNMLSKSVQENITAINILTTKKDLTKEEKDFLIVLKKNLGNYYFEKKDYKEAEKLYLEYRNYYKDTNINKLNDVSGRLYKTYENTNNIEKRNEIANELERIENQITKNETKIKNAELLLHHYANIGDIEKIKIYSLKIISLNKIFLREKQDKIMKLTDLANQNNIEIIEKKNVFEIYKEKRKKYWYFFLLSFLASFIIMRIGYIKFTRKKNKQLAIAKKNAQLFNRKILEEKLKLHEDKINNLQIGLNIKKETENAIIEKIKKVRNMPNNTENVLRELFLEISDIIKIDKKNLNLETESAIENKSFKKALSEKFPSLSEQELQLCVYFRLNLNAKEVSLLTNVTDKSIRVYKSKIKSKLLLKKEENLMNFLQNI